MPRHAAKDINSLIAKIYSRIFRLSKKYLLKQPSSLIHFHVSADLHMRMAQLIPNIDPSQSITINRERFIAQLDQVNRKKYLHDVNRVLLQIAEQELSHFPELIHTFCKAAFHIIETNNDYFNDVEKLDNLQYIYSIFETHTTNKYVQNEILADETNDLTQRYAKGEALMTLLKQQHQWQLKFITALKAMPGEAENRDLNILSLQTAYVDNLNFYAEGYTVLANDPLNDELNYSDEFFKTFIFQKIDYFQKSLAGYEKSKEKLEALKQFLETAKYLNCKFQISHSKNITNLCYIDVMLEQKDLFMQHTRNNETEYFKILFAYYSLSIDEQLEILTLSNENQNNGHFSSSGINESELQAMKSSTLETLIQYYENIGEATTDPEPQFLIKLFNQMSDFFNFLNNDNMVEENIDALLKQYIALASKAGSHFTEIDDVVDFVNRIIQLPTSMWNEAGLALASVQKKLLAHLLTLLKDSPSRLFDIADNLIGQSNRAHNYAMTSEISTIMVKIIKLAEKNVFDVNQLDLKTRYQCLIITARGEKGKLYQNFEKLKQSIQLIIECYKTNPLLLTTTFTNDSANPVLPLIDKLIQSSDKQINNNDIRTLEQIKVVIMAACFNQNAQATADNWRELIKTGVTLLNSKHTTEGGSTLEVILKLIEIILWVEIQRVECDDNDVSLLMNCYRTFWEHGNIAMSLWSEISDAQVRIGNIKNRLTEGNNNTPDQTQSSERMQLEATTTATTTTTMTTTTTGTTAKSAPMELAKNGKSKPKKKRKRSQYEQGNDNESAEQQTVQQKSSAPSSKTTRPKKRSKFSQDSDKRIKAAIKIIEQQLDEDGKINIEHPTLQALMTIDLVALHDKRKYSHIKKQPEAIMIPLLKPRYKNSKTCATFLFKFYLEKLQKLQRDIKKTDNSANKKLRNTFNKQLDRYKKKLKKYKHSNKSLHETRKAFDKLYPYSSANIWTAVQANGKELQRTNETNVQAETASPASRNDNTRVASSQQMDVVTTTATATSHAQTLTPSSVALLPTIVYGKNRAGFFSKNSSSLAGANASSTDRVMDVEEATTTTTTTTTTASDRASSARNRRENSPEIQSLSPADTLARLATTATHSSTTDTELDKLLESEDESDQKKENPNLPSLLYAPKKFLSTT